jgi:nucleoside-diphosphate-sugar epimerase
MKAEFGSTGTLCTRAPRRLGKPRLLIVGCGDTGMQVLERLAARQRVFALTSTPARLPELRAAGAVPLLGNLDDRAGLARLRGLACAVLMLAPPPAQGPADTRSARLAAVLRRPIAKPRRTACQQGVDALYTMRAIRRSLIVAKRAGQSPRPARRLVYASTTGVYGDAHGARLDEVRMPQPDSDRARRRVAAENVWRGIARSRARAAFHQIPAWRTTILRIPGIYGPQRLPLERLRRGLPRLAPAEDVFTNHIEIGDLATAAVAALWHGLPQRVVHACDGQELLMGDYFDMVADAACLPRPPRLSAADVRAAVSPAMWSFMKESRRLDNTRLTRELRVKLAFPTVQSALRAWYGDGALRQPDAQPSELRQPDLL